MSLSVKVLYKTQGQKPKLTKSSGTKIIDFKVHRWKPKLMESLRTKITDFKVQWSKPKLSEILGTKNCINPKFYLVLKKGGIQRMEVIESKHFDMKDSFKGTIL